MAPPTNCLSPIGDALVRKGLMNFLQVIEEEGPELELALDAPHPSKAALEKAATVTESAPPPAPEAATPDAMEPGEEVIKGHKYFLATVTRPPKVYRGNPFQVEVGLAFGGSWPADKPIELYRFANRVPLLFQKGACGVTEAVVKTDWKNYMLSQSKGALPVGPMALLVHIASVWVPFTSESKEAIAHYPELIKEIQLGVQEVGRKLAAHIRKRKHADLEAKRRSIFELYIEELGLSMGRLLGMDPEKVKAPFLEMAREFTADADLEQAEAEAAVAAKAAKKKSADDEDEER